MKMGIVCSSGGGVFAATRRVLRDAGRRDDFFVITDRPCGAEQFCAQDGVPCVRIEEPDNAVFSRRAAAWLRRRGGVDCVCLFYLRLVTDDLFGTFPTFNFHPSLLPAFRGFGALRRAQQAGARFLGATLHLANDQPDAGPIVAQVSMPMPLPSTDAALEKLSFLQKTYLLMVLVELLENNALVLSADNAAVTLRPGLSAGDRANPCLTDPDLLDGFRRLQLREGASAFDLADVRPEIIVRRRSRRRAVSAAR